MSRCGMVLLVFRDAVREARSWSKGDAPGPEEKLWKVTEKLGGGVRRFVRSNVWLKGVEALGEVVLSAAVAAAADRRGSSAELEGPE